MTDFGAMDTWLAPIGTVRPLPVDEPAIRERLRLTVVGVGLALLGLPVALFLGILSILSVPLGLAIVGFALAWAVVPATEELTRLHRRVSGALLDEEIPSGYAPTEGTNGITRPFVWLRDPARWRDVGFLWFSATGGFVLSALPALLLTAPVVHLVGAVLDGGLFWWLLVLLDGPMLVAWWLVTPTSPGREPWPSAASSGTRGSSSSSSGSRRSPPHGRRPSTTPPPRYAGSSATCTTARRRR